MTNTAMAGIEPATHGPAGTEPAGTETAGSEPAGTESAAAELEGSERQSDEAKPGEAMPSARSAAAVAAGDPAARSALLERLCGRTQFPSLGLTVARIVSLAQDADESLQELGNLILGDVYLTQRVLALANAALFRRNAGGTVTTVSRAIVILGFEQVRLLALGMLLIERIDNRQQARVLRAEFLKSFYASVAGRELASIRAPHLREEIGIASLLRGVGRLMVGLVDYDTYGEVRRVVGAESLDEEAAASRVLGMSYTRLTGEILSAWGIPDTIVAAAGVGARDAGHGAARAPGREDPDAVRRVVDCAQSIGDALARPSGDLREHALTAIFEEHGRKLGFGRARFDELVGGTMERCASLRQVVGGDATPDDDQSAGEFAALGAAAAAGIDEAAPEGSGARLPCRLDAGTGDAEPGSVGREARKRVLDGIQGVTEVLAQGQGLATVLRTALEAMHTGFGYRRSVLLLPMGHQSRPVGCLYADRGEVETDALGEEALSLLKTLRNQIVLALRTVRT